MNDPRKQRLAEFVAERQRLETVREFLQKLQAETDELLCTARKVFVKAPKTLEKEIVSMFTEVAA